MRAGHRRLLALLAVALIVAACSGSAGSGSGAAAASPTLDPAKDKLAQVLARGTLVLMTDPDYAPQSMAVPGATRAANTKCESTQLTAPEMTGYDAETGKLVAAALGVEPCFVTPPFSEVIAGGWGDRWDVAWASGALTAARMKDLFVTQPYYSTPASFFVRADSTITDASQLAGKQIGACSGCTHELFLKRQLELPGETLTFVPDNPKIVTFEAEPAGLKALADGQLDAFLCSSPVGEGEIKNGLALKELPVPAFYTQKTGYVDRHLTLAPAAFLDAVNGAIRDLHTSGKLKALSQQFFGADFATAAAKFDLSSVGQTVP